MRSFSIAPAVAALGLVAAVGLAVLDGESGLLTWRELSTERSDVRSQVDEKRRANAALEHRIEALLNDPHEAERAIRQSLDLAKPGETIVRFKRSTSSKGPSVTQASS